MGFFSYNTADTNESIPSVYAGSDVPNAGRTVYLLQPNGQAPIKEEAYEGYGRFGGVGIHEWLEKMNGAGTGAFYFFNEKDNVFYCCKMHLSASVLRNAIDVGDAQVIEFDDYSSVLDNGKTPNDCIRDDEWVEREITAKYPLKFSFNPQAVYEDLSASSPCQYQGYFYP